MTVTAVNYAKVLDELSISKEAIQSTREIFREVPGLTKSLENPLVPFDTKCRVIDRVIPQEMGKYIKIVCKHQKVEDLEEIFEAYDELCRKEAATIKAVMRYVTLPQETQLEGIKTFLCREFQAKNAEIEMKEDKSLMGGFILQAGGREYDWSLKGRYRRLEQKLTRR